MPEPCASSNCRSSWHTRVEPLPGQKHCAERRADGGDSRSRRGHRVTPVFAEPPRVEQCVQLRVAERDAGLFLGRGRGAALPIEVMHRLGDAVGIDECDRARRNVHAVSLVKSIGPPHWEQEIWRTAVSRSLLSSASVGARMKILSRRNMLKVKSWP